MPPLPAIAGVQSITGAAAPARTAAMRRSISAGPRCGGSEAGAGRIRFLGRRLGRAAPGRPVRLPKGAAGIRRRGARQQLKRCRSAPDFGDYFPFTLSVIGTLSMRLRDLTMSFVVSAYFLKCGVSKCALNASAFKAHLETPHFKKYAETTKDMVKSRKRIDSVPITLNV